MGDSEKNSAMADTQAQSAADEGGAAVAPAHEAGGTDAPVENNEVPSTPGKSDDGDKKSSAEDTVATAAADDDNDDPTKASGGGESPSKPAAIVASSKKARPPYKYDPDKITLVFLFAGRDGLTVTVECKPGDTVGEVKGALLSVWPEDLPDCEGGDNVRLVCMGLGFLMPDTRTLEDCQIPVFKTHPTPVNVAVKPSASGGGGGSKKDSNKDTGGSGNNNNTTESAGPETEQASQGCACTIL
ncbi:expressed unknown protein [Seminavis robusta]|uniref:UBL3-like ubiquitin domain-containing protein n=1 Tax=Seminavis robusta TaxID=568900 RepID=A0A9N8ERX1_9STRA|nr:expressed unknown protein [Seminavis robusta]|eukprot:Sro1433_g272250.1 n/a (243) ;mRNA; r:20743-21555